MVEPEQALFPSFWEGRFVASSDRAFRNQLRELMRKVTAERAATMALFRKVITTFVGRGSTEITELVSALLRHSVSTALAKYDLSMRRRQRCKGLRHVLLYLNYDRPTQPLAVTGISDGQAFDDIRASALPSPPRAEPPVASDVGE